MAATAYSAVEAPNESAVPDELLREHIATYQGFVRMVKIGLAAVIILLIGMALFLL